MAKVRTPQHFTEAMFVAWLGRNVDPGEVVDVPDKDLPSYLESGWTTDDKPARKNVEKKES